ncbi:cytokine-inducible SH2-containing protein-like [Phycodurus eques]|uniref:cytokine-inducible SH2-containing protein-like n=1 Tax=Phycodurus eques TaxID=693459 RepID=UPI002ACE4484|nr:cytokine-inducible SH2-containing protein-like [Phycodurus eques]
MVTTAHPVDPGPCSPHDEDMSCIATTFHYLHTSGWYWGSISARQARDKLLAKSEGTFLVRDSSHPKYMVALSVMTHCGPTSVRIQYKRGSFWLDSLSPELPHLQSFPNVVSLIQRYTGSGHAPQGQTASIGDKHVQFPPAKDSAVILKLMRPLRRPETFPRLQHLARLTINQNTNCPDKLPLPKPLLDYLHDYPFHI